MLELLDQAEESNANFIASRQRAERVHAESQAQLARVRAAMRSGQHPIDADALCQAAAATEAQLARLRAAQSSQRSIDPDIVRQAQAATEADLARLRAGRGGQQPIGADALNQALGEAPSRPCPTIFHVISVNLFMPSTSTPLTLTL